MMGSAERGLLRQGLRYSLGVRLVVAGAASLVSLVLNPTGQPAVQLLVVLALNAWNASYARILLRGAPLRWLAPADVLVMSGVCLTQVWTTSPEPGGGPIWVLIAVEITVVAYPWQRGTFALAASTLTLMAAYLTGSALADPDGWLSAAPTQLWMVMEATLSWALYRFVRRSAQGADRLVERGERFRREAAVAAARRIDEREYLAALHDTASATLLMVGAGVVPGRERWLADQAGRDLEVIRGPAVVSNSEVDLMDLLRDVVLHTPLRVRWQGEESVRLPAVDAVLLSHGAREALTNVVTHAGTDEAEIRVHRAGDTITVEVADEGRGFDPDSIADHHYGVTRSLVDRMERAGGSARITSRPGRGTRVLLTYPLSTSEPAEVHAEIIATTFEQGLRWAVMVMSVVILLGLELPRLLANLDGYRAIWPQILAMAGFFATTSVVAIATWRNRPLGSWRWPLLLVVFALSALATEFVLPEYRLGPAHWADGDAGWCVVLLLLECRFAVFATVLLAQYAMTFARVAVEGVAALTVVGVVNANWIVLTYQFVVGMIAVVLRGLAGPSAKIARAEEQLRTTEAVAAQLHRDRKERYAELAETTVPLLDGLASGALDPGDEAVRQACAVEAAKMRRLLAEDATVPDPLLHELRACIDLAERNGVSVSFAECGTRPAIPTPARRKLTEPAAAALITARGKARLTVSGADGTVTVSVVADCPPDAVLAQDSDGVRTSTVLDGDRLWIKATWRGGS